MTWEIARAVGALASVLALLLAAGPLLRRLASGNLARRAGGRLGIVETIVIDGRRRLVLVRQDEREHLLLLGPHGDLVVASGSAGRRETPA